MPGWTAASPAEAVAPQARLLAAGPGEVAVAVPAGQLAVERDAQRRQVFAEDLLQAVVHAASRAVGEAAEAHRTRASPGETLEQLPEAALQAVVGLADVLQDQDGVVRQVQLRCAAAGTGQRREIAALQAALKQVGVTAEIRLVEGGTHWTTTKAGDYEMAVAYDEVSVARSCEKLKIENLGYDCNELIKQSAPKAFAVVDVEWIHSNGERDTKSDKSLIHIDKSKYTSIASGENFEDGNYELMWYWLQIDDEGNLVQDQYLGMDQVIIENGFLTFAKKNLSMEYFIQWKNRKDIYFKTEDGLILISANLDLSSDGETESIEIVGPTSTDIDGNYYAEGFWGDSSTEGIGMKFKPISN